MLLRFSSLSTWRSYSISLCFRLLIVLRVSFWSIWSYLRLSLSLRSAFLSLVSLLLLKMFAFTLSSFSSSFKVLSTLFFSLSFWNFFNSFCLSLCLRRYFSHTPNFCSSVILYRVSKSGLLLLSSRVYATFYCLHISELWNPLSNLFITLFNSILILSLSTLEYMFAPAVLLKLWL